MTMALPVSAARIEQPPSSQTPVSLDQRTRRAVLGSLALVMLLASLDSTVVGTALPQIVSDLRGNDIYAWVFTIYLLTMTVSMPMYAALSDRVGRTPVLFFGVALFLAASALCGLSTEMWQLVLFRGIQGLGAGALAPVVVAIVGDLFSPADRARYQPLLGSVFLLAFLVGPTVGGVLTDTVGWHWVFYINLPLGLFALLVIWRVMPRLRPVGTRHHFDVLGVALFALAVVPILIGLRNLPDGGWADPAVGGLMLLGAAFAALFLVAELRAEEPIIPVRMFRNPTFAVGSIVILLAVAGLFVSIVYMPRYFQFVRGATATESGWQLMALLVGVVVGAVTGGQIAARTGHWKLLLLVMMGIGVAGMVLLAGLTPEVEPVLVWAWMFMAGFGVGPVTSLLTAVIQSSVAAEMIGTVSGTVTFFRQFGASLWLAISGTVFATVFRDERRADDARRSRCGDPRGAAARAPGGRGAGDRRDRGRHPRGVLGRHRQHVLDRDRGCRGGNRGPGVPPRGAVPEGGAGERRAGAVGAAGRRRGIAAPRPPTPRTTRAGPVRPRSRSPGCRRRYGCRVPSQTCQASRVLAIRLNSM
jgi:EmrB/QacA subfamily drug resistance transporter